MTYSELFLKYPIVKQLAYIQLVAYFGAWFSNVAIYSMMVEFQASALLISIVAAMYLLPGAILAPFSGTVVDMVKTKPFMIILMLTELTMTLCFLVINSLDDVYLLLLFLFIRMGSASVFFTAQMTYLPKLLKDEALVKANELHSIIWSFTFTAGMAAGGFVVDIFGVKFSFLLDAFLFLVAVSILSKIKFELPFKKSSINFFNSIKDGMVYLKENKHLWKYIFLHATVGFTSFDAIVTLLADYNYKYVVSVPLAIGLTNAIRAFALMIGPSVFGFFVKRKELFYLVFVFQGLSIIFWALIQDSFYLGLFGMFLTGLTTTTIWSYTYARLQVQIQEDYLGRVLAYNEMIFMTTNVLVTLGIGLMASLISLDIISAILGVGFLITSYFYKRFF